MNNEDKLIDKIAKIDLFNKYEYDGDMVIGEKVAKEIIQLVRDSLIENHTIVPDGIYKQMRFESDQFRVEHPNAYLSSYKE